MGKRLVGLSALVIMAATVAAGTATADDVTVTIESWRNEDLAIWQDQIIPAFEAANPGIKVEFTPAASNQYDAALNSRLEAGTAGDLITCRPFDVSLALFQKGQLASLNDLPGIDDFSSVAKSAWSTDDASSVFCVPMGSVLHGFYYNKDAFAKLGVEPPKTVDEFYAVLDALKADGTYIPMALGAKDQWESEVGGYQNIGPNYWHGEEGRLALIAGAQKLTDPQWVAPYEQLAKWSAYLGDGYKAQGYSDSQNLFTLGKAAIYPGGSWEIAGFNANATFPIGVFAPPVPAAGDQCYVSDHTDIGIGLNAASKNPEAARKLLEWIASPAFGEIFANALPGFFWLGNEPVTVNDPLAAEFVSWRGTCQSTIRSFYQILSRGTPNLENESYVAGANVLSGVWTPAEAAQKLQAGLDSWYRPN